MTENTRDIARLGYREIDQLGDMLKEYAKAEFQSNEDKEAWNPDEIAWEYNPTSDNLFLVNADYQVLMLNDNGKLESFLNCGNCGNEGLRAEVEFSDDFTCKDCKTKQ